MAREEGVGRKGQAWPAGERQGPLQRASAWGETRCMEGSCSSWPCEQLKAMSAAYGHVCSLPLFPWCVCVQLSRAARRVQEGRRRCSTSSSPIAAGAVPHAHPWRQAPCHTGACSPGSPAPQRPGRATTLSDAAFASRTAGVQRAKPQERVRQARLTHLPRMYTAPTRPGASVLGLALVWPDRAHSRAGGRSPCGEHVPCDTRVTSPCDTHVPVWHTCPPAAYTPPCSTHVPVPRCPRRH
jgi:hypothetical protein